MEELLQRMDNQNQEQFQQLKVQMQNLEASTRKIEEETKKLLEAWQNRVYEETLSKTEQEEAAPIPSYGEIVDTIVSHELSDDFSSVADEEEETKEKVKEAEDVPFEEPLPYKELKPYVPPITFSSRLHKSKWNKWFSELISSHFIANIYLPLLIVCRNMPVREKFFQDLITYRRKFETLEFG